MDFELLVYVRSKLGVPIKTTISANVLEEALNNTVTVRPLPLGRPLNDKVLQLFHRELTSFLFLIGLGMRRPLLFLLGADVETLPRGWSCICITAIFCGIKEVRLET